MTKINVKEPQNPVEGEHSLDQYGEVVVFRNGEWLRPNSHL
jgi:hypothetical protein|tara:strand:- start:6673 stop:6795 length:123 start_codon:yes stop_codon:yes gene_type:complete